MTNFNVVQFSERNVSEAYNIRYNIFNRFFYNIRNLIAPDKFKTKRTYEEPYQQFYIVMIPLKGRNHNIDLVSNIFKQNGLERILVTKETQSGAPHYNVILTTLFNYSKLHTKVYKKFKLHVSSIYTIAAIDTLLDYVFKESQKREFLLHRDYNIYCKT